MEDSMESISTNNPAITENMECSIIEARTLDIDQNRGCVTQSWYFTTLFFQLLWTLKVTFQTKNSLNSAPASSARDGGEGGRSWPHVLWSGNKNNFIKHGHTICLKYYITQQSFYGDDLQV